MRVCDNCRSDPAENMVITSLWDSIGDGSKPSAEFDGGNVGDLCPTCIQAIQEHNWTALDELSQQVI